MVYFADSFDIQMQNDKKTSKCQPTNKTIFNIRWQEWVGGGGGLGWGSIQGEQLNTDITSFPSNTGCRDFKRFIYL